MRYLKMVGAVGLALAAMMAIGMGGVTASTLTQAPPFTGTVKAESEGAVEVHGSLDFKCQKSILEWSVEEHGASVVTGGPLGAFTLEECGNDKITVFNRGRFALHATTGGNGTMTWSGAEITVELHRTVFGFPLTTHCIYKTNGTDLGTFTGSATTKATAKLDLIGTNLPQTATDGACGENAPLTGSYTFTSLDYLVVD